MRVKSGRSGGRNYENRYRNDIYSGKPARRLRDITVVRPLAGRHDFPGPAHWQGSAADPCEISKRRIVILVENRARHSGSRPEPSDRGFAEAV
jgi:hypothetical protein